MSRTTLPYERSACQPGLAKDRIEKILRKFKVSRMMFEENIETQEIILRFVYGQYPISIPIDYGKLAETYMACLKNEVTDKQYEKRLDHARKASYSILQDYVKSLIVLVELGVMDFESTFIGHMTDSNGVCLGEHMKKKLPQLVSGK